MFENVRFKRSEKFLLLLEKYVPIDKFFIFTDRFEVIHVRCRLRMFLEFVFPKGQYLDKHPSLCGQFSEYQRPDEVI